MKIQRITWLFSIVLLVSFCFPLLSLAQDCDSLHADFFKTFDSGKNPQGVYGFSNSDMKKYNAVIKAFGVKTTDTLKCYDGKILYERRYSNNDTVYIDSARTVIDFVIKDNYGYVLFLPGIKIIQILNKEGFPVPNQYQNARRLRQALKVAFALLTKNNKRNRDDPD